jgi:hypothetical protein
VTRVWGFNGPVAARVGANVKRLWKKTVFSGACRVRDGKWLLYGVVLKRPGAPGMPYSVQLLELVIGHGAEFGVKLIQEAKKLVRFGIQANHEFVYSGKLRFELLRLLSDASQAP